MFINIIKALISVWKRDILKTYCGRILQDLLLDSGTRVVVSTIQLDYKYSLREDNEIKQRIKVRKMIFNVKTLIHWTSLPLKTEIVAKYSKFFLKGKIFINEYMGAAIDGQK